MNPTKKTTVTLCCANCNKTFEKNKHEYRRRLAKLPGVEHFFCSLSCSASSSNKKRAAAGTLPKPIPQYGNKYKQKYPEGISWYITRCVNDKRNHCKLNEEVTSREDFALYLDQLWDSQQGMCAISGVSLERKNLYGHTNTSNPFKIASIDRIDCARPYERGNVHWISQALNHARNNMDLYEFEQFYKQTFKLI